MSEPSRAWMSVARSGVSRCRVPSRCDWNSAPSSVMTRRCARLNTWKPPLSVRIGRVPADEAVQAAAPRDQLVAGPQEQVIGVAEDDLGAGLLEIPVPRWP